MSETHDKFWQLNRRNFLKFAGFTAAGVTLGAFLRDSVLKYESVSENWNQGPGIETFQLSICRQCPAGCGLRVRIVDGAVKKLDGNPLCPISQGTLCPKGQAGLQVLYNPDRLLGPVIRTGKRGQNQWKRISWDEAMIMIQNKLNDLRTKGKPETLAWLTERNDATQGQLVRRFMQAYGSPNLFELVDLRDESARIAMEFCQGIDKFPAYDLVNTKYILSIGTPLLESWLSPTRVARQFGDFRRGNMEERGQFVYVGSRLSPTAVKADEWLPIQPGTETALVLAIANVLIREDLYDRAFVDDHTFGLMDWTDNAGHEQKGLTTTILQDYQPSDIAELTGIPVNTIFRLARDLAQNKPSIVLGEQVPYSGGVSLSWAVHILNGLNGMIDRKGGILTQQSFPLRPLPEFQLDSIATSGVSKPLFDRTNMKFSFCSPTIPILAETLSTEKPYPLEALFISSTRFLSTAPESDKFYKAMDKIPFIVSFSSLLDDSAAFADLILPDHTPLEKWVDVVPLPTDGRVVWGVSQPAIESFLDTRDTREVISDISHRIGGNVAEAFPWKESSEILRFVAEGLFEARRGTIFTSLYENAWLQQMESGGWWVPTAKTTDEFWEQLLKNGGWWDPFYSYEQWQRVFQTPSGKFEFVSQTLFNKLKNGLNQSPALQDMIPKYQSPQWTGDEKAYPLKLHLFTVLPTGGLEVPDQPFLQETLAPLLFSRWESWVELNPVTANKLGISSNDTVWLESPLGKLQLRARIYAGTMPDVANVLVGNEHRAGGEFVNKTSLGVADLVKYTPDPIGTVPLGNTTRVKIYKV